MSYFIWGKVIPLVCQYIGSFSMFSRVIFAKNAHYILSLTLIIK